MKNVTSTTIWNDSTGTRISVTYSEIDEATHMVVADNQRKNFVLVSEEEVNKAGAVSALAQALLESSEA